MGQKRRYVFKIEGKYSISTLPMERLAQYMADLARLLGDPQNVHFVELVEGSIGLVTAIEPDVAPVMCKRLGDVEAGSADVVHLNAYRALNKMLREDESDASFFEVEGAARLLDFPGQRAPRPLELSGIPQAGRIDGTIIGVGGTKDDVPVHVQSGARLYKRCVARKPLAKKLAQHLFEGHLRLHGQGRWERDSSGVWTLQKFTIHDFEELDDAPLASVIEDLRAIEGARWHESPDLWAEVLADRRGDIH